jgi:hypothetical protein
MMETHDRHDSVEVIIRKGNRFPTALLEPQIGSPSPAHRELLPVRLQDGDLATALGELSSRRPRTSPYIKQTQ